MITGFYTARSGLISRQQQLNVIANNVANVGTIGFKPQQAGFSELLQTSINGGSGTGISCGHGTKLQSTGLVLAQGEMNSTGVETDCAILGNGFFALQNKGDDSVTYTRAGSFRLSVEDGASYLVNPEGCYVLDASGDKIDVSQGFDPAKIGVYDFKNPYGLQLLGSNQFSETAVSGEASPVEKPEIKSGYLENSSVELAKEMVGMIEASKGFSFNSKIIQTADEMEESINHLR